jgi:transposase InsO family protein
VRIDDLRLGLALSHREEWADNDNAGTAAEAQAFKRACSCFGLGRYLYYFSGTWVDLDERKRPKSVPRLVGWATPQGWRKGLRPSQEANTTAPKLTSNDANLDQAERSIARWIEEYNHDRPHRGLHGRTPHDARAVFVQTITSNTAPCV